MSDPIDTDGGSELGTMTKKAIAVDKDGNKAEIDVVFCPLCQNNTWCIYFIDGNEHLQCAKCSQTYCAHGSKCGG
jgi:hypothetical protein